MKDTVELLLQDKSHPVAKKLLAFHLKNRKFLSRMVGELRLLKKSGQPLAGAKSIFHYLRWSEDWNSVDEFAVNDHFHSWAIRVCALLWPDTNGMVRFRECAADEILNTRIVRRGKRSGGFYPGKKTLSPGWSFLRPERDSTGLFRPIQSEVSPTVVIRPPGVSEISRPRTFHEPILDAEAAKLYVFFESLVASSPNPRHPILQAWLRHVKTQPETFVLMERTLQERQPTIFSAASLMEYSRWSIRRAVQSHKLFTLPSRFEGLYCRALIVRNDGFNGLCKFKADGKGGRANRLLGCYLAPTPSNGEAYRRLVWGTDSITTIMAEQGVQ